MTPIGVGKRHLGKRFKHERSNSWATAAVVSTSPFFSTPSRLSFCLDVSILTVQACRSMLSFVVVFVKQPTAATSALKLLTRRRFLPLLASSISFSHFAAFPEPVLLLAHELDARWGVA